MFVFVVIGVLLALFGWCSGVDEKQKRSMTGQEEIADKRKVKLDLQIEHLKLQNHKTKPEILQLETALNLPRSEFTQSFARDYISYGEDQRTT